MTRRDLLGFAGGVVSLASIPVTIVYVVGQHVLELLAGVR